MHKVGVNTKSEAPAVITVLGLHDFLKLCVKCCELNEVGFLGGVFLMGLPKKPRGFLGMYPGV